MHEKATEPTILAVSTIDFEFDMAGVKYVIVTMAIYTLAPEQVGAGVDSCQSRGIDALEIIFDLPICFAINNIISLWHWSDTYNWNTVTRVDKQKFGIDCGGTSVACSYDCTWHTDIEFASGTYYMGSEIRSQVVIRKQLWFRYNNWRSNQTLQQAGIFHRNCISFTHFRKIAEVCGYGITIDGKESIPDFCDDGGTTSDDGWSSEFFTLVTSFKAVRQTNVLWPGPS